MRRDKAISGMRPARWKPGSVLLRLFLASNLLVGTPAWSQEGDEAADQDGSESAAPAKTDESKAAKDVRPALTRRKRAALNQFDPKVYEARGRELQGEYYEIASFAKAPTWSSAPAAEVATSAPATSSSKNWIIWSGAASLAVLVGGAAGYLMLDQHTEPQPVSVHLDDKP